MVTNLCSCRRTDCSWNHFVGQVVQSIHSYLSCCQGRRNSSHQESKRTRISNHLRSLSSSFVFINGWHQSLGREEIQSQTQSSVEERSVRSLGEFGYHWLLCLWPCSSHCSRKGLRFRSSWIPRSGYNASLATQCCERRTSFSWRCC